MTHPVIVIGAGLAGWTTVREFRKLDTATPVVVVTAASHRREAFEAAAWIMDRIKERVPIWKRERYPDAVDTWVEGEQRHV